ncbi:MAG TPA: LytTR family DNA-binding domain-containing protein [Holophagaceae bacterium]|nr:LytTR family DNA-binding domain-containing protein [Holophagaceae bacterium]
MSLRALIVDDEILARQRIRQMLQGEGDIEVVQECSNGLEAVETIEKLNPDLVFLDIQMPELDGFGVLEAIGPDRMPATIFVTAYDQYAVHAFDVNAVDYLLKPFDKERFQKTLQRIRDGKGKGGANGDPQKMEDLLTEVRKDQPFLERILVRVGERQALLKVSQVQWVEAEDNYVRLHVEGGSHLLRQTMNAMSQKLDPHQFRRIHRSAIVNMDYIKELQPWSSGDYLVIMRDGTRLTLSRTYRPQFSELK